MNRQCICFFFVLFRFPSFSQSVWTYSLFTHTQQKRSSDKWYTHLNKYQCLFSGNNFQLPLCTICVNTHISKAVMATAFESVQSIASSILLAAKIKNHAFFVFYQYTWDAFQACNQVFSHPSPLCIHKLLLQLPPFLSLKCFRQTELRSESELTLKRGLIIFMLVSSEASISNLNESQFILSVSKTALYVCTWFLSMSIDTLRCDRLSCRFKKTEMKNVMPVKEQLIHKNNSFTYLDWWACASCFLKECIMMYPKEAQIEQSTYE